MSLISVLFISHSSRSTFNHITFDLSPCYFNEMQGVVELELRGGSETDGDGDGDGEMEKWRNGEI